MEKMYIVCIIILVCIIYNHFRNFFFKTNSGRARNTTPRHTPQTQRNRWYRTYYDRCHTLHVRWKKQQHQKSLRVKTHSCIVDWNSGKSNLSMNRSKKQRKRERPLTVSSHCFFSFFSLLSSLDHVCASPWDCDTTMKSRSIPHRHHLWHHYRCLHHHYHCRCFAGYLWSSANSLQKL